ncbi:MAG: D-alanine--D-alanine ligase, partial [Sphingobacteriales bacterium]
AVEKSFFKKTYRAAGWNKLNLQQKVQSLRQLVDIREGIGMPVLLDNEVIYQPEDLLHKLEEKLSVNPASEVILTNVHNEAQVLVEGFISGKEFSCIVVQNEAGEPVALPPTEIIKGNDVFDYRSKYLPGLSRKVTPIDLPVEQIREIRKDCARLFKAFNFNVYARLDGFITAEGEVFLNDPNTTSGMLPSSFFFHQAAEIGLNPSQFLTYIIRTSLAERIKSGKQTHSFKQLLQQLDQQIDEQRRSENEKIPVAVIMGGYSSERHISVESGRNIYEKLSSSAKYDPFPVFLTGSAHEHRLYRIPVNMMLKDNADDIRDRINYYENGGEQHPVLVEIAEEAAGITAKYTHAAIRKPQLITMPQLAEMADVVFIALHGRPGEDGALQTELEKYNIPYNGSGIESSRITINKFETNEILAAHGVPVAKHRMVTKQDFDCDKEALLTELEEQFGYPLIAKPADDGCSSAVKKIKNRAELEAFARMIFRPGDDLLLEEAKTLALGYKEEFPCKMEFLVEELISPNGAKHFLEITGGLMTRKTESGEIEYEIFEASEALASGEVLSLEEKFLAGEGQNITPARYAPDPEIRQKISDQVKDHLKKVAQILKVEGYARIDAFVRVFDDNRAETIIIEINSLPGMTPATCIFHQTAIQGYKPYDFIDGILTYGMKRTKDLVK